MRIVPAFVLSALVIGPGAGPVPAGEAPPAVLAVKCGTLIDGTGAAPVRNAWILVEGDRITAVGPKVRRPRGARVLDLSGYTVLPGLIDCHTHLTHLMDGEYRLARFRDSAAHKALKGAQYAREILEAGFTSCRNVGAGEFADVALRDAINGGYVPGPRLQVATHGIGITGGHCDANGYRPDVFGGECGIRCGVADGPEEVRRAVRYAVKYGADVIKTCATGGVLSEGDAVGATQYSSAELEVMVEEAHNADRRVAAHAHGTEGIKRAIRAGVASIEHGSILDDEAIALMVLKGTYLVPTLYVGDAVLKMADEGEGKLPPGSAAKAREIVPQMRASFRRAAAAGVKIAFGTDVGVFPHRDAAREFARLVGEGLSPMRAILAATREAATLMGWEDRVGTLEAGKFADLIAVKGDPLQEIRVLEEVRWVLKGGVVVKAPE